MAKGGARIRSGPARDPNSLRSASAEWTTLPADGRSGPAPSWPLPGSTRRELEVWASLWVMPQAVEWERLSQQHLVGLYVRRLVEAEESGSSVSLSTLVRQLADELALTSSGMARARLRVAPSADAEPDEAVEDARPSVRDRLTMVPGGAA